MSVFRILWPPAVTQSQVDEFRDLCERTSRAIATTGREVVPYESHEMPRFQRHSNFERVLETLRNYTEVLESAVAAKEDLEDSKHLVWRMIQRMGYVPKSDVFDKLEDGDTIEIYTTDNWQVFRNLRFFDFVSVTVEEMCTLVWNRDTERDLKITWDMLSFMLKIKMGFIKETTALDWIPKHNIRELLGKGWLISIQMKLCSPLSFNGSTVALLTANRSELIEKMP